MLKKLLFLIMLNVTLASTAVTTDFLIGQLDSNEVFTTAKYDGEMIIFNQGKTYIKKFMSWGKGRDNFFIEFINSDDRGTRYLKLDGKLYYYKDDEKEVIPIVDHMLKDSMMGSDLSYEDTIDNTKIADLYDGQIIEETIFSGGNYNGRPVYVLSLTAKTPLTIDKTKLQNEVLKNIRSKKRLESAQKTISEYYEDTGNEYKLKLLPDDTQARLKLHYKLAAMGLLKGAQYGRQICYIDKETFVSLKTEMYTISGSDKIKEIYSLKYEKINNRYFTTSFEMRDLSRDNSKTTFHMKNVELDIKLDNNIFSIRNLQK